MPLDDFVRNISSGAVGSGQVLEQLLNNQYRVLYQGRNVLAVSQAGRISAGTQVTLAHTAAGLVIISAGVASASAAVEVIING